MTDFSSDHDDADYADWRSDATPPSLWDRVLSDDSVAWEKLVTVWTPCVFEYCRRKGIQETEATDVVQQVMIRVFRFRESFSRSKEGYRLKAWILMIIKQSIADYFRQFARKNLAKGGSGFNEQLGNIADPVDSIEDLDDSEECFDAGIWMARTLDVIKLEVTEQTWEIFRLFKIEGLTAKEVGERFGMKENTVRQRVHGVVQRIKREADGLFDESPNVPT